VAQNPKTVSHATSKVLLRKWNRELPIADRAEGCFIVDRAGRKYLDASGGAYVVNVGHGVHEVNDRIKEQLERFSYVNGNQFANAAAEELAQKLIERAPSGFSRVSFLSSGSEAVEAALKFARQYFYDSGDERRGKIISRKPGYHGNTMLALGISGRPRYQKYFGPLMLPAYQVPGPMEYRCPVDYETEGAQYYLSFIEQTIKKIGRDEVLAVIVEPVGGSSTGGQVPPPGYHKKLRELCNFYGIFLIADEVLCGCGRTGEFYASSLDELDPDIIVLGKGLNGGYIPLSAILVKEKHVSVLKEKSGHFMHQQTYMMHPLACAAGLGVIDYIDSKNLLQNAKENGAYLKKKLMEEILPHKNIGHITGIGMLYGLDLVENKKTTEPFSAALKIYEKFATHAQDTEALIVWPNSGHYKDDERGDMICIAPPLSIQKSEIDDLVGRFGRALKSFKEFQ
jgi:adenosylmethionine-8-amino-7-oxononanoate aminotransferase